MPPWWIIWINNPYLDFSSKEKPRNIRFRIKKTYYRYQFLRCF